jgi:hypothetical protein
MKKRRRKATAKIFEGPISEFVKTSHLLSG